MFTRCRGESQAVLAPSPAGWGVGRLCGPCPRPGGPVLRPPPAWSIFTGCVRMAQPPRSQGCCRATATATLLLRPHLRLLLAWACLLSCTCQLIIFSLWVVSSFEPWDGPGSLTSVGLSHWSWLTAFLPASPLSLSPTWRGLHGRRPEAQTPWACAEWGGSVFGFPPLLVAPTLTPGLSQAVGELWWQVCTLGVRWS